MMRRLMLTPTRGGRHGESSTANRVYRSFAIVIYATLFARPSIEEVQVVEAPAASEAH